MKERTLNSVLHTLGWLTYTPASFGLLVQAKRIFSFKAENIINFPNLVVYQFASYLMHILRTDFMASPLPKQPVR